MSVRLCTGVSIFLISSILPILSSYTEPLLLWPLGNHTLANEVKVGGTPASQNEQAGLSFYSYHVYFDPNILYVPAYFNGPLDLQIPSNNALLNSEFSLFFFVWTKRMDGSLIHYKTTTPTPNGITELKIWMSSLSIQGFVKYSDNSMESSFETVVGINPFQQAVWYRVGIGVDKSNANMIFKIYMNDEEALRLYSSHGNLDLDLPGILRIGSSFDDLTGLSNIEGMVACVLLYGISNPGSVIDMQNECNTWNESKSSSYATRTALSTHSENPTTAVPDTTSLDITTPGTIHTTEQSLKVESSTTCNPVTTPFGNYDQMWKIAFVYYVVLEKDASPQLSPLFNTIITFSLSACASHCLQDRGTCFAFTLTKSLGSRNCTLYGDVKNAPKRTVAGTNLYILFPYTNTTSLNNC